MNTCGRLYLSEEARHPNIIETLDLYAAKELVSFSIWTVATYVYFLFFQPLPLGGLTTPLAIAGGIFATIIITSTDNSTIRNTCDRASSSPPDPVAQQMYSEQLTKEYTDNQLDVWDTGIAIIAPVVTAGILLPSQFAQFAQIVPAMLVIVVSLYLVMRTVLYHNRTCEDAGAVAVSLLYWPVVAALACSILHTTDSMNEPTLFSKIGALLIVSAPLLTVYFKDTIEDPHLARIVVPVVVLLIIMVVFMGGWRKGKQFVARRKYAKAGRIKANKLNQSKPTPDFVATSTKQPAAPPPAKTQVPKEVPLQPVNELAPTAKSNQTQVSGQLASERLPAPSTATLPAKTPPPAATLPAKM